MIRYLTAGIAGTVLGLGTKYLYDRKKAKQEEESYRILYAEAERQLSELGSEQLFEIGDRVITIDPNMGGVFAGPDGEAITYTIEDVKLDEDDGVYRYKMEGDDKWYSSNWIEFVGYEEMAKHSSEMFKSDGAISDKLAYKLEIDYWLQCYAYEKEQGNEEGVQEAVNEINRLRDIANGK